MYFFTYDDYEREEQKDESKPNLNLRKLRAIRLELQENHLSDFAQQFGHNEIITNNYY